MKKLFLILILIVPISIIKANEINSFTNGNCNIRYVDEDVRLINLNDFSKCNEDFYFIENNGTLEFERSVQNLMQKTPADPVASPSEEDANLLTALSLGGTSYTNYVKERWTGRLFIGQTYGFNAGHLEKIDGEYYISARLLSEVLKSDVSLSDNGISINPQSEVTVITSVYTVPTKDEPKAPEIIEPKDPSEPLVCNIDGVKLGSECPPGIESDPKYSNCNIGCVATKSKKEEIVGTVYDAFNPSDVETIKSLYTSPKYPFSRTNWEEYVPWLKKQHPNATSYYTTQIRYVTMTGTNCTGNIDSSKGESYGILSGGPDFYVPNVEGVSAADIYAKGSCTNIYVWVMR